MINIYTHTHTYTHTYSCFIHSKAPLHAVPNNALQPWFIHNTACIDYLIATKVGQRALSTGCKHLHFKWVKNTFPFVCTAFAQHNASQSGRRALKPTLCFQQMPLFCFSGSCPVLIIHAGVCGEEAHPFCVPPPHYSWLALSCRGNGT